uniref:Uncharacterized protein n=1 Tax=Arundo donax TaxID=35708 RepID=A0A0A9BHT7_ARUDO
MLALNYKTKKLETEERRPPFFILFLPTNTNIQRKMETPHK